MPPQIPTNDNSTDIDVNNINIRTILDPIKADNNIKHSAWDAYYGAKDQKAFKDSFDKLNLPTQVKHDLWNAKYSPQKYKEEYETRQQNTLHAANTPQPKNMGEWISSYSRALGQDLRFGTGQTKAGVLYKKLGGQPFYNGTSQKAADYLMSLPEGILDALEGTGDLLQNKKWEGIKKVVGGGFKMATIPASFMAPEEAEIVAKTGAKTADEVGNIAKYGKQLLNPKSDMLPVKTAPRELKMGEAVQAIIKDNMDVARGHVKDATDELDYMKLILKAKITKGQVPKNILIAYNESKAKLSGALSLQDEVNKFGGQLGNLRSPEQIITKLINGGKQDQSMTRSIMQHIGESPKAVKNLQDSVVRGVIEKYSRKTLAMGNKVDWVKVQNDLFQKGDMAKDLLGSRYYPVLEEVNKLSQQQRLGKAAVITTATLTALGLTSSWYLRHALRTVIQTAAQ